MRAVLGGLLGRIPLPSPAMGVALLALLIAASGAAVAAIPSSDGTIIACRDNKTDTLRVIDAEGGKRCTSKETQLSWKDGSTLLGKNEKAADSDKLDGKDSTDFAAAYKRTVVVSPTGTDTENGTALIDALSGITDASAAKPYLLYVEPGTYDLGIRALSMMQHVDIQGAGERKTLITGDVAASSCQHATVVGANNAELRFLTARNTSGSATTCTIAIYYPFGTSSRLTNVTAEATGVGGDLNMGVYGESESNLALTNVTATAAGATEANYGVRNDPNVSMTMFNVTAAASGGDLANVGVLSREPTITIRHSKLSGSTNSLNHRSRDGGQVALSQLVGPVSSGLRCLNNYDENMEAVSCP